MMRGDERTATMDDPETDDQLPRCPWCGRFDDECRCAFAWDDRGNRVPLPGRAEMTPPAETEPPRRA
jgi:hypothetical protein